MPERIKGIITNQLEVKWSNLMKPDVFFGENSANHNITVVLTKELEDQLMAVAKENGVKKISGVYEKDGVRTIKFKSKTHIDKGAYPCQDSTGNFTDAVPFATDIVRLKLGPAVVAKGASKTMSFYLNGVQIVKKNAEYTAKTNGFEAIEGGYVGQHVDAPTPKSADAKTAPKKPDGIQDDEIPF
jgi:hypothetical protein